MCRTDGRVLVLSQSSTGGVWPVSLYDYGAMAATEEPSVPPQGTPALSMGSDGWAMGYSELCEQCTDEVRRRSAIVIAVGGFLLLVVAAEFC